MKRIASLIFALLFFSAAHAQTIKSGHVLGNGTTLERSATDTQLMGVMQQPGAGLGSGAANLLSQPASGTGGLVGQIGATLTNPTLNNPNIVGGTQSFSGFNFTSSAPYTVAAPATASGNIIALNLPWLVVGWLVADTTTPSAIPAGTFITQLNYAQVVLNNNVSGILANDVLSFTPSSYFSHGTPCEKINAGVVGALSGWFFDEYCTAAVGGWRLQYTGALRAWALGTPYGYAFTIEQGDNGAGYIPNGGFAIAEFPSGFTITNPNYSFPPGFERAVDGGINPPNGLVNVANAAASWATSATTISTSFGCGASFGLGVQPGQILLDISLPTGTSPASIIGTISTCNAGTGVITLTGPAAQGSATNNDTLVGIVQATYSWGGGGVGLATRAIPMSTCTGINADLGNAINDLSIPGIPPIGSVNQTACYTQIILTGLALQGASGGADNLLFGLPATTAWTTGPNPGKITVGGCDAIASPEVLVDVTLSGNPNIGAVSSCASNVLALASPSAINSSGAADPLLFGDQATAPWLINAATIPVTSCNPFTPNQAWLLDLTIGVTTVISVFQGCASPTSILLGGPAAQASAGSADRLLWSRQAYQTWASGSPAIVVNAGTATGVGSCAGVTAGEVVYDMNVGGGSLVGTVASCQFYTALSFGGQVTLTAPSAITVTHGDYLVFATSATSAFTTTSKTIPITSCNNFVGPALFDAAVTLTFVGSAAGCGGLVTLTGAAAQNSSGPTDNLVPATPATAAFGGGTTSINVASCAGFANPQYLADMTLATPAIIGQISTCSGGVLTLVSGALHGSLTAADLLAPSTQAFIAQGSPAAGGDFAWSNAVQNIPVANCAGASAADAVLDLSLAGMPLIGTIGVCSPTLLITYPSATASADLEGFAGAGSLDYLLFTSRRTGDYRINQAIAPGGFALWAATSAGTVINPAAPIALDPGGTAWLLGSFDEHTPVPLATLPTCAVANVIKAGVMTSVAAGTKANISNGVAAPTYNLAVGSTVGTATDSVYCYFNGSAYSWIYR